jgi:hypothetical protein
MSRNPLLSSISVAFLAVALAAGGCSRGSTASNACVNNLRNIVAAKQQWVVDYHKATNDVPTWDDLRPYLERGVKNELPHCPAGGKYTIGRVDEKPTCSVGGSDHTLSE